MFLSRRTLLISALVGGVFAGGYLLYQRALYESNSVRLVTEESSDTWAVKIPNDDLNNFYKVSDILYRGAQPDKAGMRELQKLGIKTIVNLRQIHSDKDELAGLDLGYVHIRSIAVHIELKEVEAFLDIMASPEKYPVFVHCQHGSDRTGTMCAFYRMVFEGWSKEQAIKEMTEGGFGFHAIWRKSILPLIEHADIQSLRAKYNK